MGQLYLNKNNKQNKKPYLWEQGQKSVLTRPPGDSYVH